jgi:hypothetical protein
MLIGQTMESRWREPRAACGAIVGTLRAFNPHNAVHRRIRDDLGEANYALLSTKGVRSKDGVDVTAAVAAGIVAIQGMKNTALALTRELDERGLGHLTASTTLNRPHLADTIIYFARATVFGGEIKFQGFGTDASKYSARVVEYHGDRRLLMTYDGIDERSFPIDATDHAARAGDV